MRHKNNAEIDRNLNTSAKFCKSTIHLSGTKDFSDRNLRMFRRFYLGYQAIWEVLTARFQSVESKPDVIWQSLTAKCSIEVKQ